MVSLQSIEAAADRAPTTKLHGSVRVSGAIESIPWTAELPEDNLAYEGLVLLVPGFGGIKRSSRGEREANASNGIPSISYGPARLSWNLLANLVDSQELHRRTAGAVMSAASEAIQGSRAIPNKAEIDLDRFILSAHSMGGFAATEIGLQRRGHVESVVYKASPGFSLHGIDPVGFLHEFDGLIRSGEIEPSLGNYARFTRYFLNNPLRTAGEAVACMAVDIRPQVARLGDLGVKLAYLGFEDDSLVPPDQVMGGVREVIDVTHVMPSMGHLAPQRYPQQVSEAVFSLHTQAAA